MSGLNWSVDGRDWPHREASRFVRAAGLEWHVQQIGAGPLLLLLHGTGSSTHSWSGVMDALAGDFTLVAADLPGHGFTRGRLAGGPTLPNMARAVAALLAALEEGPPSLIAGHSAGAAIGAQLLLDAHATSPLIGITPALLPFPGLAARLFPALARALFVNPFAAMLFARMARVPGEVERFMARSTGSRLDAEGLRYYARLFGSADHCAGAVAMMANWDLETLAARLPELTAPVLLLAGANDSAIPESAVRGAAERLPNSRFQRLEGLGHLAPEEDPARIAGIIRDFARVQAG